MSRKSRIEAIAWGLSVLGLSCMVAPLAQAVTRPMHFEHVTLRDGLSQNSVMSILQDSQGFMWLATENGLNRYDGYSIRSYNRDRRNADGLRSDFIWTIAEDDAGDLWLATEGGGVVRWNRQTDTFESFLNDPDDPDSPSSNITRTLLLESDERVWIGTRESGLDLLDPSTGHVVHYRNDPEDPQTLSNDAVYVIYRDRGGRVWVGTERGLNRFQPETGTFARYLHDPDQPASLSADSIISLFEDHAGVLWVGTRDGGLNRFDDSTGGFTHFRHDAGDPNSLSHDHVRVIFEEGEGRLWVGTQNGLNLMDRDTGTFARHLHDPANPQSLGDSYVMSLYSDRSGTLWVGTRAGGASRWNPRSWSLGHFKDEWLYDTDVTAFADDGAGGVWVGTMSAGLVHLDSELERLAQDATLGDEAVMSLLLGRDGILWVGTMTGGLNRLDPATGLLQTFRHEPTNPRSLGADGVMSLYEDAAGGIWVGTFGGGVALFDEQSESFRRFPHDPQDPKSLSNPRASVIVQDGSGAIWVGTHGGGLNLVDPRSGTVRRFGHHPDDPESLSSDTIYALHADSEGLWVGTAGGGLDRLAVTPIGSERARFENVSTADGLPSNVIYGIHPDERGNLWLSSNNGLTRFDPDTRAVKTFHRNHGLQGEEFNFGAHHLGRDGKLYFGGANGFNVFDPLDLDETTQAPPVVLTSFEKLNRPAETDSPYELVRQIELGYRDDVVTFEFAALDFVAPERNRYAYRLDGFDADWVDIGHRRRVTYTNLDARDYVFRVRAANSDGVWNEEGLAVALSVAPAPWETGWAYAGYLASCLFLLLAAWRHQRRELLREAEYSRQLEHEVRDRTTELERRNQELKEANLAKSEFLARMSHEIRTPMNGVLGMTELLQGTELDSKQQRFAGTIRKSAASLLEIINDILDFSKIEAGKLELETVEFDLIDLVEDVAELLAGPASEKGLEFICATPPDHVPKVLGDPLRLRQVLINLIGNAVKFTDKGEVIARCFVLSESSASLEMRFEVEDSGAGINRASQSLIFDCFSQEDGSTTRRYGGTGLGLAISKQLVELMGGEIGVESVPREGSTFWFTVRLKKATSLASVRWTTRSLEKLRVLIVDSNATHRRILERQLAAWHVRADCARSGQAALQHLKDAAAIGAPYDLAILDMGLQDTDGEALLRAIREDENLAGVRLLLMSSVATQMTSSAQHELGVDRYLLKPVRQSYLYDSLIELSSETALLETSPTSPRELPEPLENGGRVLLVEDNPVNQAVALGMLNVLGCEVVVVDDGKAAVDRIAREDFDLVLMDCQMPVMDGFAATGEIRRVETGRKPTPIVALTASALDGDRQRCLDAGMDDYLSKPFTIESLQSLLAKWLDARAPVSTAPESASSAPEEVLLDETALENIRKLENTSNPGMLARVIELYLSNSTELMAALKRAFDRNDSEGVRQAAHTLKSSSANLGALSFAETCRLLEEHSRSPYLHQAERIYLGLARLYPKVVAALQVELQKKSA